MKYLLEQIAANRRGLRIEFQPAEDRMQHQWWALAENAPKLILSSVETDLSGWPASPPLQQLSLETHRQQDVILGVGMCGRSHWSVAVQSMATPPAIAVEAACRVANATDQLRSRYLVAPGWTATVVSPSEIRLAASSANPLEFRIVTSPGATAGTRRQAGRDLIEIRPETSASAGSTVRWSYRMDAVNQSAAKLD